MSESYRVQVSLERRDDGGLRVWSDDVPELVLSHADADAVLRDLPLALAEILSAKLGNRVSIEELKELPRRAAQSVRNSAPRQYVARAA